MDDAPNRREVLSLGLGGLGLFLSDSAEARPAAPPLPPPPAVGRSHRDFPGRRGLLYALMGDLPDRERRITARKRNEEDRDGYVLETLDLDLNGLEPVPAYFARPKGLSGRGPAVVFNHSHGGGYTIGKKELLEGRSYLQPQPYAAALTELGCSVLCIDHWVFGERSHTSEADTFKAMLWQGRVLWGMMVYDSLRAVDYLVSRPDVDPARIGTLGMSMGSTMAWWLAALDERIKATADICCLTESRTLLARKGLAGHGIYYYVPSLLKHFTTADINALIAPRAHLGLAGTKDELTPAEGLDIIDRELKAVYAEMGHPERWTLLRYDVAHQETPEGRQAILEFLRASL
jgi:pimeloyl-ACP methyl ester carboxylesterase